MGRNGRKPGIPRRPRGQCQYAAVATEISVDNALANVAAQATGDMQNLFAAIDFSHPDGTGVRSALRQVAPTPYDHAAHVALQTGRDLSRLVFDQITAV